MTDVKAYLFTSMTCPHCPPAKRFAEQYFSDQKGITFEHLSAEEPKAQQKAAEYGVRAVPTFVIVGPGYDQPIGVSGTPTRDHMDKLVQLAKGEITVDELR